MLKNRQVYRLYELIIGFYSCLYPPTHTISGVVGFRFADPTTTISGPLPPDPIVIGSTMGVPFKQISPLSSNHFRTRSSRSFTGTFPVYFLLNVFLFKFLQLLKERDVPSISLQQQQPYPPTSSNGYLPLSIPILQHRCPTCRPIQYSPFWGSIQWINHRRD